MPFDFLLLRCQIESPIFWNGMPFTRALRLELLRDGSIGTLLRRAHFLWAVNDDNVTRWVIPILLRRTRRIHVADKHVAEKNPARRAPLQLCR